MAYTFKITRWDTSKQSVRALRERVFVLEWQLPFKLEFDDKDETSHHLLVYSDNQEPIATARMTPSGEIGRIAVKKHHRSLSLYKALFNELIELARQLRIENVYVRCNLAGVDSMRNRGFLPHGQVFMEAGIPMQRLRIDLSDEVELPDIYQLH